MNNILKTQELSVRVEPLDFRLDLLRLTFKIEEKLENFIKDFFILKQVSSLDMKDYIINEEAYIKFRDFYKHKEEEKSIWNMKDNGKEFFNVFNFINRTTFGGLVKLIELIKFEKLRDHFWATFKGIEFSIFKKWIDFIKDIRNILAHRTNINPEVFWEKTRLPTISKKLRTIEFNPIKRRQYIFWYFLKDECDEGKIGEIFDIHNIIKSV